MIKQKDIKEKANEWGTTDNAVDKDYVLGHFLNSFYSFEDNRSLFVFKGGTCLRKCYFPEYRFSEDLDFTLTDTKFSITTNYLRRIADDCTRNSGILFGDVKEKSKIKHDNLLHVFEFVIPFWGANHPKRNLPVQNEGWHTRIELDFSSQEIIRTPVEYRKIYHRFDDMLFTHQIPVYSLKEIITEKIRSFEQRSYKSARDYYDVWYLMQNVEFDDWDEIRFILNEKCNDKNVTLNPYIFEDENRKYDLQKSWAGSLGNQLTVCPDFEAVWCYLKENLFQKLKLL